jgi:excisionase family DNA binding protein
MSTHILDAPASASTLAVHELPPESLLTPEEVARLFRVTRQTVMNWARHGRMKCVVIGHVARFPASGIAALLERP